MLRRTVKEVQGHYNHFVGLWRDVRSRALDWPVEFHEFGGAAEEYQDFEDEDVEEMEE